MFISISLHFYICRISLHFSEKVFRLLGSIALSELTSASSTFAFEVLGCSLAYWKPISCKVTSSGHRVLFPLFLLVLVGCGVKLANSHSKMTLAHLRKQSIFVHKFDQKEKKSCPWESDRWCL